MHTQTDQFLTILGLGLNNVFCVFHIVYFDWFVYYVWQQVNFTVLLLCVYVCILPEKASTKWHILCWMEH